MEVYLWLKFMLQPFSQFINFFFLGFSRLEIIIWLLEVLDIFKDRPDFIIKVVSSRLMLCFKLRFEILTYILNMHFDLSKIRVLMLRMEFFRLWKSLHEQILSLSLLLIDLKLILREQRFQLVFRCFLMYRLCQRYKIWCFSFLRHSLMNSRSQR